MPSSLNSMLEALEDSTFDELMKAIITMVGSQKTILPVQIDIALTRLIKSLEDTSEKTLLTNFFHSYEIELLSNGNNMVLKVTSRALDKKADDFGDVITLEQNLTGTQSHEDELSKETQKMLVAKGAIALPSFERKINISFESKSKSAHYTKVSIAPFEPKGTIQDYLSNHIWQNKPSKDIDRPVIQALYGDIKHAIKIYRALTANHVLLPDGKYANLMKDAPMRDIKSLKPLDGQNRYQGNPSDLIVTPGYIPPEFEENRCRLDSNTTINLEAIHACLLGRNMFVSLTGIEPPCYRYLNELAPLYPNDEEKIERMENSLRDNRIDAPFSAIRPVPDCFKTEIGKKLWALMKDLTNEEPKKRISLDEAEQKLEQIVGDYDLSIIDGLQQLKNKIDTLQEPLQRLKKEIESGTKLSITIGDDLKEDKNYSSRTNARIRKYNKVNKLYKDLSDILEIGRKNETPTASIALEIKNEISRTFNGNYRSINTTSMFGGEGKTTHNVKDIENFCNVFQPELNLQSTHKI